MRSTWLKLAAVGVNASAYLSQILDGVVMILKFANSGIMSRRPGISENVLVRRHRAFLPSDVFVASCPRSGNTWLRLLLTDLMLQRDGLNTDARLPIHQDDHTSVKDTWIAAVACVCKISSDQ